METLLGPLYSSAQAAELSGLSYRQVDYYARTGLLVPFRDARGSGTRRVYDADDLARLRLVAALKSLGAPSLAIASVLEQLPRNAEEWPVWLFVSPRGELGPNIYSTTAAWWVNSRALTAQPALPANEQVAA